MPALTGLVPWLTPLAALGLVLTMIGIVFLLGLQLHHIAKGRRQLEYLSRENALAAAQAEAGSGGWLVSAGAGGERW